MSDWQVGDLAVCVDASPDRWDHMPKLALGRSYKVTEIGTEGGLFLADAWPASPLGWNPQRFRKIRPDEHEDCEPEFVELLKRSKTPARVS